MTAYRIFQSGRRESKAGHQRYVDFQGSSRTVDQQQPVVEAVVRERARRALYANCDRAPFGWEEQLAS